VAATASTLAQPTIEAPRETPAPTPPRHEQARAAAQAEAMFPDDRRRIGQIPLVTIAAVGAVALLIAAMAYLLVPQLSVDTSLDPTTLPNARLVQEGTPVTALAPRATPITVASGVSGSDVDADGAQATQDTAVQPTPAAGEAPPAVVAVQPGPAAAAGQPSTPADPAPSTAALFDERFSTNDANWPSSLQGLGLFTNGTYRIATRQAGQFAAIGAPLGNVPADVQISADFRKLGGPDGGGYGIIVRDQQQGVRDGSSQDGRYYVLEAGDKGEVGIWRRDGDHWVDLLPWQHSEAVKPGTAPNQLSVRAVGNTLSLTVNGMQVASKTDSTFASGQAGVFVGGDGNQVGITRFTIQTP
jgi:hypothetical protein